MENTKKADDEENKTVEKPVNLDTILINEIGQFGLYQLKTVVLAAVAAIFIAWASTEYIFTAARISTRCLIPECEASGPSEFAPPWILNAIPPSGSSFDNCLRFANVSNSVQVAEGTCPVTLFDQPFTVDCEQYVYQNTHTVVYDFDLACDEWRRSFIGSARTMGMLVGLPISGFISDRWGRRMALTLAAFNTAWLGVVRYWANTYIGFLTSEIVECVFGAGGFSSSYILLMELVGPKYRVAVGVSMSTFFAVGQVLLGLIAWAVPDWRQLTLVLYIPQLITITYLWLMSESVRWYLSKGSFDDAARVLKDVARMNKKTLADKSLEALRLNVEEENKKKALLEEEQSKEPWLIVLVFRHKKILIRCLVIPVWWITNTFIYYGLTINSLNITGNSYVNYITVSAIEIPGFWMAFILMSRIGRKPVLVAAFWICAACQAAYLFMPDDFYALSLTVYLIAKFSIAMVATSIYVYTAELFPTRYRHRLFAFCSMMGRIGAIVAPLTPAFGDNLPFILFGCFALVSGVLVLITPETLGTKFPDTMEEAEQLGQEKQTD